jgi:hypothetical protein
LDSQEESGIFLPLPAWEDKDEDVAIAAENTNKTTVVLHGIDFVTIVTMIAVCVYVYLFWFRVWFFIQNQSRRFLVAFVLLLLFLLLALLLVLVAALLLLLLFLVFVLRDRGFDGPSDLPLTLQKDH